jgi:hypothetical protein
MTSSNGKPLHHDSSVPKLAPESAATTDANVQVSIGQDSVPRLPHEHDESADSQTSEPRAVMQQAAKDLKRGLVDTDRGAEANQTYAKLKGNFKP